MKVAVFDAKSYDRQSFELYQDQDDISFKYFEAKLTKDTARLAKGYDAVCVFVNDLVDANVIEKLAKYGVEAIALRCAGYNNVDLTAANNAGIKVVRVPAYSPYAVAEHAIAMLLTSVRKIHKAYIRTRDYNFSLEGMTGFDLHGKTVGVIGTGKIGRVFIDICTGFGMNIIAYDKFPAKSTGIKYVSLDEIWEKSDIISLHCPLTDESHHMIEKNAINKMKTGVIIINTSRGALIDAESLLEGIKERKIGGACLDVYEEEADVFYADKSDQIINDDVLVRLISMPNVIVTSHQAFLTNEALDNIAETTFINLRAVKKGAVLENEVK